ncbi:hypothetical protein J3Q64DRAFT_1808194 [Phycomyces blakesleeanus]|uniref:NADH-cytochrome b5 reductase n=1 Tax=Phycomyces blakesleeanus TaxID=4837 RepID=A0ABR3BAF1_PHYBL
MAGLVGWSQWTSVPPHRLLPDRYTSLKVLEKEQVSPDTFRLRLETERQQSKEYPVMSSVYIKDDSIQVMRPYTPINPDPYQDGHVDLLIKRYENGSVSRMLSKADLHDVIHVRGPMIEYDYQPNSRQEIGMIAGGTGITPMYQLIQHILHNPADKTKMWLIYGSQSEKDILLREELDKLAAENKDRLRVMYLVDRPSKDWEGQVGYVSEGMVKSLLGTNQPVDPIAVNGGNSNSNNNSNNSDSISRLVFVCGPDKMLAHVCGEKARDFSQGKVSGVLGRLGLTSREVWKLQ